MRTFMRKYISNRGSALFMVLSTMTALMLSCMAMYFSVISSRSTQYAIFNQQHSNQVSLSVADMILSGMMGGSKDPAVKGKFDELREALGSMNEGDKISAESDGFSDPDSEGSTDYGEFRIDITCLAINDDGSKVIDILITTRKNGANTVYHNIISWGGTEYVPADAPSTMTDIFAATGYVPNDVFINGFIFYTDVFFDNELTYLKSYGAGFHSQLYGNLATGGSLISAQYLEPDPTKPLSFSIFGDYKQLYSGKITFAAAPAEKSLVLIGGDVYYTPEGGGGGGIGFENANVYIRGNLYLNGTLSESANYFVGGNVYVTGGQWPSMKNVYCNGVVDATNNNGAGVMDCDGIVAWTSPPSLVGKTYTSWTEKALEEGFLGYDEYWALLLEKTASRNYYKWIINDSDPSKDNYIAALNESSSTAIKKTLNFSLNTNDGTYKNAVPTEVLKYSAAEKGCIITGVNCEIGNGGFNHLTLIIDTGEDENNVYTIRVKPNRDMDGDGIKETFTWLPPEVVNGAYTEMSILVKGRGSVVIDIPKGVIYQDLDRQKFMHYGWFVLGGGTETDMGYGKILYKDNNIAEAYKILPFIHRDCYEGDGCVYSEVDSTGKCEVESCGATLKNIKCTIHGTLETYCPNCTPERGGDHTGACKDHVDRKHIKEVLDANPSMKARMVDSEGEIIYPTTNIYLVSCDESAEIRMSRMRDETTVMLNSFFGYIYAPYMTFKAAGGEAGGVRYVGGMTVSDYVFSDSSTTIACWPEKMPTEIMGNNGKGSLPALASKGWKVKLLTR